MAQFPSLVPATLIDSSKWRQSEKDVLPSEAKQSEEIQPESLPTAGAASSQGYNQLKRSSSDPLSAIAVVADTTMFGKESKSADEKEDAYSKSTPIPTRPKSDNLGKLRMRSDVDSKVKTMEIASSAMSAPSIILPSPKEDSDESDVSSKGGSDTSPRKKTRRESLPKRKESMPGVPTLGSASSILPPAKKEDSSDSDGSMRADSRGSSPREKKVRQERKSGSAAGSAFFQTLGASQAHRTVAVSPQRSKSKPIRDIKKIDEDESKLAESKKAKRGSSKYFEQLNKSRAAHQTVAVGIHDVEIGRKKPYSAANLRDCLLTTIPPLFFLGLSGNFEEKIKKLQEIESKIEQQLALIAIAEKNQKAGEVLNSTDYYSDKIRAYKAVRKGLQAKPKELRKALDNINEDLILIRIAIGCKETKEKNLKVEQLEESAKKEVVSEIVAKLKDTKHESSKFLHKRLGTLQLDAALIVLEDHVNSMESMMRAITAQYAGLQQEAVKILNDEIEFLEIIENCEGIDDVKQSIRSQIHYYSATLLEHRKKKRVVQDEFKKYWCTDSIKNKAEEHLAAGTWPELSPFASMREKIESECIFAEMAYLAIEKSQTVHKIKDGSGDVRMISHGLKFICKSLEGAPGKPGNEKEQTPNKLKVVGDRSLVSSRIGFPVSEGFEREMAQYRTFNTKPRRTIVSLPLSPERPDLVPVLLMEYIEHDFSLDDLANAVRRECYEQDPSLSKEESERLCSGLPKIEHKTEAQQELIRLCMEWKSVDKNMKKIALMPLWDFVTPESYEYLIDHSFRLGDCDRNPQNILVKLRDSKKDKGALPLIDLIPIDFDQILPDSFVQGNMPAFVHTKAADIVLSNSEGLKKAIIAYDAAEILDDRKKDGIHFQEHRRAFPIASQEVIAGGETYNFLHAVHTVAKLGLANGNTASDVAEVIDASGRSISFMYDAFVDSKKLAEQNQFEPSQEYRDLCKTKLYQICFAKELPDFKLWKNFENIILIALNKKKHQVSPQEKKK